MYKCVCECVCQSLEKRAARCGKILASGLSQNLGMPPKMDPLPSLALSERENMSFFLWLTRKTRIIYEAACKASWTDASSMKSESLFLFFQHLLFVCQRNLFDGGRRARQRVCRSARWCIMFHWFIALFMRSIWETEFCDSRWKILNIWLHIKLKSKMLDRLFSQTNSLRFFKWNLYNDCSTSV